MAPINTKNVHRTNFLLGHPWGDALVYDELVMTTIGDAGQAMAEAMAKANPFSESPLRPGGGSRKDRSEAGLFDIPSIGASPHGQTYRASVPGHTHTGPDRTSRLQATTDIAHKKPPI